MIIELRFFTSFRWGIVGEDSWHSEKMKYVPGNYDIEFKSVAEHATPSRTNVTVTKGSTVPDYTYCYVDGGLSGSPYLDGNYCNYSDHGPTGHDNQPFP